MRIYELSDLDEAMNAIKEEMVKELTESLLGDQSHKDTLIDSLDIC